MTRKTKFLLVLGLVALTMVLVTCKQIESTQPKPWVVGFWVYVPVYAPYTEVVEIRENGILYNYDRYDCSGPVVEIGTWSQDGDTYTGTVMGTPFTLTRISDDEFDIPAFFRFYRKGTEPGGNVFSQPETLLSAGDWMDGSILHMWMKLYSFTASSSGGNYEISWERLGDTGSYDADYVVSAYKTDEVTAFFIKVHDGYTTPWTVALVPDEKIYIIVYACYGGGTYRIQIQ